MQDTELLTDSAAADRLGQEENGLIDIALNLTDKRFRNDLDQVYQRARDAGVTKMVITGTDMRSSEEALTLAKRFAGCYATAGIHPHVARDYTPALHQQLLALHQDLSHTKLVAVGETGLDFNRDFSPRPAQEKAFEQQLEIAAETRKPVLLHQRDAHSRFLPILKHYRDALPGAVVHCFTDTRESLFDYLDLDCHIGITGWICDERRGQALQQLVRHIPNTRFLLETDAPYLMPRNYPSKMPEKGRNEPMTLPWIAKTVAHYREQTLSDIIQFSTHNALSLFNLES